MTSVRREQEPALCQPEPPPDSPRGDPLQTKAEFISGAGGTFVSVY